MAFGQSQGPPASRAQLEEMAGLLEQAGFESFREARHPYGLTQRQSNGKFTRGEADELLDRLRAEADEGPPTAPEPPAARPRRAPAPPPETTAVDDVALAFPDEVLAAELRRRGWRCSPPG